MNITAIDGSGGTPTLNPENNPLLLNLTCSQPGGEPSIKMFSVSGTSIAGTNGQEFTINIRVGNPNVVTDLVGVSCNLEWDNTTYVEAVSTTAGSFFGANPLIITQNFTNRIEIGVTSTTGGKDGTGVIAKCTLRVKQNVSCPDQNASFNLMNIISIDNTGADPNLNPINNPMNLTLNCTQPGGEPSIRMNSLSGSTVTGNNGQEFIIDVEVGNPNAVTDLIGVAFNLEWNDSTSVEAVSTSAGSFFGTGPLLIAQNFPGRIEIGVTSTTGGKSGSGIATSCTLRVKQNIPCPDQTVSFNLINISALDGVGNPVTLNPENNPLDLTLLCDQECLNVWMPDTATSSTSIEIPVYVEDLTGQNIISYQYTVSFDNTILQATGINTSGTITPGDWTVIPNPDNTNGELVVGAFGFSPLSGGGVLTYLQFDIITSQGLSDLDFEDFMFNAGVPCASTTDGSVYVCTSEVDVNVPDTSVNYDTEGPNVSIPVLIEDVTGLGIYSYGFDLFYNQTYLTATGVGTAGTLSNGWTVQGNTTTPGKVIVGGFGTGELSGGGTLLYLNFTLTGVEGISNLDLANFIFNNGCPIALTSDGSIEVTLGLCGDVNCDDMVSVFDAARLLQYIIGVDPNVLCPDNGDVDMDNNLTTFDCANIARYSIGLDPLVPTCLGNSNSKNYQSDFLSKLNLNAVSQMKDSESGSEVSLNFDGIERNDEIISFDF
ncbi:cohesin domain-containing protein, partial [Bacteroidota bacterium]